jgi:superfamily II DNA helicase RecQ
MSEEEIDHKITLNDKRFNDLFTNNTVCQDLPNDDDIVYYLNLLEDFKLETYRENQMSIIHGLVKGLNQMVIMKTSGGKTLPISI